MAAASNAGDAGLRETPIAISIRLTPGSPTPDALSPEQKRFNTLTGQIAQARARLVAWQQQVPLYHQAYVKRIAPLLAEWRAGRREAVFTLDAWLNEAGWNKVETATLREVICERVADLLAAEDTAGDPALKALFDKHSDIDFDAARAEEVEFRNDERESADDAPGVGSDHGPSPVDEDPAEPWVAAKAAHTSKRAAKKSAAQQRREDESQQATQSLREVFRKLASALHPDREPDSERRAGKTVMMQRVNQAYAANDLLALLELQLEIEQIDAGHMLGLSAQRLKHYNKVLASQLADLKAEVMAIQARFEASFGLYPDRDLDPSKLDRLIDLGYQQVSAMLADQRHEARMLQERAVTRRWLKQMRLRDYRFDEYR